MLHIQSVNMKNTLRRTTRPDEKNEEIESTTAIKNRAESDDSSSAEAGFAVKYHGVSRRRLLFKYDIRIVTLLTLAYLLSYIDRSNVGMQYTTALALGPKSHNHR